ncbi:MAG: hypothetical protein JSW26_21350 [Desulfobacterales bacterium]|nr:MAG: hypothetical protein JSW26_21350 [Desulfobacterales bacterium]
MRKKRKLINAAVAFCLLVAASCSLTNLNAVWKDPQYQGGKLKNVLVICESTNQVVRRIFEDEFTARFKSRGTNAIPSYTIFPSEKTLNKDTIESKSRDLGIDSMLVARIVDTKTKREVTPAPSTYYYRDIYFYDWPNPYSPFYSSSLPGRFYNDRLYYREYEVVNLDTGIYETQTGRLIWSALSDTVVGGSTELEISSVVETIMKNLAENQLIK